MSSIIEFPSKARMIGQNSFAHESSVRRAAVAAITALAPGDPAFVAIKGHEAAREELCRFANTEPDFGSPERSAWQKIEEIEIEAYQDTFDAMLETIPTTRTGAVALIEHFADNESEQVVDAALAMKLLHTLAKAIPKLA